MSENTSETENQGRSEEVRGKVQSLLNDTYLRLYRGFDALQDTLQIAPAEVVEALEQMGEGEIREHYAEWADIDIREDDATTLDPIVPDPAGAGSYATWPPAGLRDFTAADLLHRLALDLPFSYVEQTGGGTATLVIRKSPGDNPILGGPGAFNWGGGGLSTFRTGEFYYGPDTIGIDGDEPKYDGPGEAMDPAWTLEQLADRIRATYAKYNAPKES